MGHTLVRSIYSPCRNISPVFRLPQVVGERWLPTAGGLQSSAWSSYIISAGNDLQFTGHFRNPISLDIDFAPFIMNTQKVMVYQFKLRSFGFNDWILMCILHNHECFINVSPQLRVALPKPPLLPTAVPNLKIL